MSGKKTLSETMPREGLPVLRAAVAVAALATVALLLGSFLYVRLAGAFLARLDVNVGEVLMKEGVRFEEAGAFENAKERYRLALDARFEGPQNRAFTLKRLGALLWNEGQFEAALPFLKESAASPVAPVSVYEPLCDALFQLKRYDDAVAVLSQWEQALGAGADAAAKADLLFHAGRIAAARGDVPGAIARFNEGKQLVPGGRNASELAHLYFTEKRYEEAIQSIDDYLRTGASGSRAEYARNMREVALRRLKRE